MKLVNICKEHESFTKSKRQEAVAIINAALDTEKKAIEKIEAALEALTVESK